MKQCIPIFILILASGCQTRAQSELKPEVATTIVVRKSDTMLASIQPNEIPTMTINHRITKNDRTRLQRSYPKTLERLDNHKPLSVQDIKNLTRSGVTDDAIIYEIDSTRSSFFLMPSDEIELEQAGVSKKVVEKMKSTADAQY